MQQDFGVLSGTQHSPELMESFLRKEHHSGATFERAFRTALDVWSVGHMALGQDGVKELPAGEAINAHRKEQLRTNGVEASILERTAPRRFVIGC